VAAHRCSNGYLCTRRREALDQTCEDFCLFLRGAVRGTDKLTLNDSPFVATRASAGPQHIAFHRNMPVAYVINELGSTITTYRFDTQGDSLEPIQVLPRLTLGPAFLA
jgi:6-phosphogluconolactonase (cycloisomerase 2 family)